MHFFNAETFSSANDESELGTHNHLPGGEKEKRDQEDKSKWSWWLPATLQTIGGYDPNKWFTDSLSLWCKHLLPFLSAKHLKLDQCCPAPPLESFKKEPPVFKRIGKRILGTTGDLKQWSMGFKRNPVALPELNSVPNLKRNKENTLGDNSLVWGRAVTFLKIMPKEVAKINYWNWV